MHGKRDHALVRGDFVRPNGGVGIVKKGKKAKTLPYRVHDNPDPQKFENLREFTAKFGYKLKSASTKGATARALNKLMDEVQGKREEKVIQTIALRSMMKAKYTTHNIGHFGLAFDYYTHFTSPIRRYPDTMVHRLITRYQNGGRSANKDHYEELCCLAGHIGCTESLFGEDSALLDTCTSGNPLIISINHARQFLRGRRLPRQLPGTPRRSKQGFQGR